jgi:hypothetical protein
MQWLAFYSLMLILIEILLFMTFNIFLSEKITKPLLFPVTKLRALFFAEVASVFYQEKK